MAKIMLVDDDSSLIELLTLLLTKKGYEVVSCGDGKECLERLARETPDLIVLDVMMPGIDGFSAFNQIRQNPATREIPVIVLTARSQMRASFQDAGRLDDFIAKPFESDELIERIAAALSASSNSKNLSMNDPPPAFPTEKRRRMAKPSQFGAAETES